MFAALLQTLAVASLALAGPPWISIEYPVNPYDASMRGAYLLVHAFHHGTPVGFPIEGTAEGIVNGERQSIRLEFKETTRTGVYALRQMWPQEGVWTLVIRANQGPGDGATAVVELGSDGEVASVKVPTAQRQGWTVPADVSMTDIDRALRARATALARRS
jgi:hypothetical protein